MKSCLSELYRKLSTQIRKELKMKEAENKLKLYKHYLPFIVDAITESLGVKNSKLNESFSMLIEKHLTKKSNVDSVDNDDDYDNIPANNTNNITTNNTIVNDDSSSNTHSIQQPSNSKSFKIDLENRKKTQSKKDNLTNHDQGAEGDFTFDASFNVTNDSNIKGKPNLMHKKSNNNRNKNKNSKGSKPIPNNNKFKNIKTTKKTMSDEYSKKKIKSADFHSTLDSFQQRRVNKGKIK
jgi:DNA topoisomerase VI subunit B